MSRTAGGRNAEQRVGEVFGMTQVGVFGTQSSMLGHKAFISFPPACLSLPKGVRATVYYNFLVSCQFALSILPFMWPCQEQGSGRAHCFTSIHVTPFITNIQIYPLFSFFSPLTVCRLTSSEHVMYELDLSQLVTQKFVYIHLHFFYTTPGKH